MRREASILQVYVRCGGQRVREARGARRAQINFQQHYV